MTPDLPTPPSPARAIVVTGDFLVDHHIYEGRRHHFGDQESRGVCVKDELGGGALIHRLLLEIQARTGAYWRSVLAVSEAAALESMRECDPQAPGCQDKPFAAYAFWRPYPVQRQSKETCWRVAEAMGYGGGPSRPGHWPWKPAHHLPHSPAVLVISDGGMGFRSRVNVAHWGVPVQDRRLLELAKLPESPPTHEPEWIILKMSAPAAQGDLWRELSQSHAQRLVVVLSAGELRRADVRLGAALSWEQTLEDVHRALLQNPAMQSLTQCRHLIIAFGSEGALWLHHDDSAHLTGTFVFDPEHVEGEHRNGIDGSVYGYLSCLTATVAASVAEASDKAPDLETAMRSGLAVMRYLREHGHGKASDQAAGFPAKALAEAAQRGDAEIPMQVRSFRWHEASCPVRPGWSLLALHETPAARASGVPLQGIARRVLIRGPVALQAPTLKIGGFFTADRGEIEALRSLRQLVGRYLEDRKADKPLSIGVFGPPGAGKSFAVKELAQDLLKDRLGWLEFNLSQFNGPADLIGALHQVRDKQLEGKSPVAFFDEFDSQNFQWLKYLLAPMQDGRFQEGQLSHPLGKCLFVFAGGTSHTFEGFVAKGQQTGASHEVKQAEHFVLSKGPDFASRLDGRLNVIGPNPRPSVKGSAPDIFFPVRRALFIRAILKCRTAERLTVHPGLVTGLLELSAFKHGSRSLAKLLEPFNALRRSSPEAPLTLSSLPPPDQLALQVDLDEFESLTRRDEEISNVLGVDKLAAAVHQFYRAKGKREGWLKPHHDCGLAELPPFDQASNRVAARRLPPILALAGLKLIPGKLTADERAQVDAILDFHADLLAEAEHDGWMQWHLDNGWSQSDQRDDARQLHNRLVLYSELPSHEQDKDKDTIHHYPDIAKLARLKIVPVGLKPPSSKRRPAHSRHPTRRAK